jgi:hypothetical protein
VCKAYAGENLINARTFEQEVKETQGETADDLPNFLILDILHHYHIFA